jgi:guanylate kinase
MKGNLFIITSPSGGGKGTLIAEVLNRVPNVGYSVSFTTRQPRAGELNGRDYFFVTYAEFENLIEAGEFLEYAAVHGNFYGTSRRQVAEELNRGRDVILEIDVQGATNVKAVAPEAIGIFILPPSFEVLRTRLENRATETNDSLTLRLENANSEVRRFDEFDYVVVNDEKERAAAQLTAIFYAERARAEKMREAAEAVIETFPLRSN